MSAIVVFTDVQPVYVYVNITHTKKCFRVSWSFNTKSLIQHTLVNRTDERQTINISKTGPRTEEKKGLKYDTNKVN